MNGLVAEWRLRPWFLLCLHLALLSDSCILNLVPLMVVKWLQQVQASHLDMEVSRGSVGTISFGGGFI